MVLLILWTGQTCCVIIINHISSVKYMLHNYIQFFQNFLVCKVVHKLLYIYKFHFLQNKTKLGLLLNTVKERNHNWLQALEIWYQMRVERKTKWDGIQNNTNRTVLECEFILTVLERDQLRWTGHDNRKRIRMKAKKKVHDMAKVRQRKTAIKVQTSWTRQQSNCFSHISTFLIIFNTSTCTQHRIFHSTVKITALYGGEMWLLFEKKFNQIQMLQLDYMQRCQKLTKRDKSRTYKICQEIVKYIKNLRNKILKWNRYVGRTAEHSWPKRILYLSLKGKSSRCWSTTKRKTNKLMKNW